MYVKQSLGTDFGGLNSNLIVSLGSPNSAFQRVLFENVMHVIFTANDSPAQPVPKVRPIPTKRTSLAKKPTVTQPEISTVIKPAIAEDCGEKLVSKVANENGLETQISSNGKGTEGNDSDQATTLEEVFKSGQVVDSSSGSKNYGGQLVALNPVPVSRSANGRTPPPIAPRMTVKGRNNITGCQAGSGAQVDRKAHFSESRNGNVRRNHSYEKALDEDEIASPKVHLRAGNMDPGFSSDSEGDIPVFDGSRLEEPKVDQFATVEVLPKLVVSEIEVNPEPCKGVLHSQREDGLDMMVAAEYNAEETTKLKPGRKAPPPPPAKPGAMKQKVESIPDVQVLSQQEKEETSLSLEKQQRRLSEPSRKAPPPPKQENQEQKLGLWS